MPHELGDIVVGGALDDVPTGAALHDPAALEDRHLVSELQGLVQIVADEQDRFPDALLQDEEFVLQLPADQGIERGERLIHEQDIRIGGQGACQSHALLHAAGELAAVALTPLREADQLEVLVDDTAATVGGLTAQLEAQADVVAHRPPRQEAKLLKHHGDAQPADAPQRGRIAVDADVDDGIAVTHQDLAARDAIQAVGRAQQRRLPRSRQSHEHRDLAALDAERGVRHAHHHAGLGGDLSTRAAGIQRRERPLDGGAAGAAPRPGAEEDVDGAELERGTHGPGALSAGRLIRSSTMASSTITKPASKPMPTCTVLSARTTGTPSPPAPTSAAITTMDRLSMMHWVIPARMVGAALGSSTFHSSCRGVAPNA